MAALTCGVVHRPKEGNRVNGDAYRVFEGGERILVAVADGLGSGEAAREAALLAVDTIAAHQELALGDILARCNQALQSTRGAAVGLLAIDPERRWVEYAGVGNIEVRSCRECRFKPLSTSGIVGANYREPRLFGEAYERGEILVMHSDGLRGRFDLDTEFGRGFQSPQAFASRLAESYAREADDVTVVVVQLP